MRVEHVHFSERVKKDGKKSRSNRRAGNDLQLIEDCHGIHNKTHAHTHICSAQTNGSSRNEHNNRDET